MPTKRDYQAAVARTSPNPTTVQSFIPKGLEQDKKASLSAILPIQEAVDTLRVKTQEDYLNADTILGRIRTARKSWGGVWDNIQAKTIKPIRAGLDALYETNRTIDGPLDVMETRVKSLMQAFKNEEARQLRLVEQERVREEQRLLQEAQALADKVAAKPLTSLARGRLVDRMDSIEAQIQAVNQEATDIKASAVRGSSSSTRAIKAWKMTELADVLQGILDGTIPDSVVMLDTVYINRSFKGPDGQELVGSWPGFVVVDETQIVGR